MPANIAREASPKVRELTVADLDDLAAVAAGAAVENEALSDLTAEDIRSLEETFSKARISAADDLAGAAVGPEEVEAEIFDNWSCCCCTPCCCCAAADVDPFEHPSELEAAY